MSKIYQNSSQTYKTNEIVINIILRNCSQTSQNRLTKNYYFLHKIPSSGDNAYT